jgi:hypothetical protein
VVAQAQRLGREKFEDAAQSSISTAAGLSHAAQKSRTIAGRIDSKLMLSQVWKDSCNVALRLMVFGADGANLRKLHRR